MSDAPIRIAVPVALLSLCVLAACVSERPAAPAPPASTAPAAAAGAAPGAATGASEGARPAADPGDQIERHLRAEGYVVRMREGVKLFCKRGEALGSRLMTSMQCATKEALQAREEHDQAEAQAAQARARTGCPKPCN